MARKTLGAFRAQRSIPLPLNECDPCAQLKERSGLGSAPLKFSSVDEFKSKTKGFVGLIKITAMLDTWATLGADNALMLSMLNDTPCVGILVQKTLARGKPPSSRRSAVDNALLTATELLIEFIKKIGVDYCFDLIKRLVNWALSFFGPASTAAKVIANAVTVTGVKTFCQILLDFIDDVLFRQYVAPYINDLFGKEIFRENRLEPKEFGLIPAEKAEVDACFQQLMEKTNALRSAFQQGNSGGFPPLPPSDVPANVPVASTQFSATNDKENLDSETKLYIIGGAVLVTGVVATTLLTSRKSKRRKSRRKK